MKSAIATALKVAVAAALLALRAADTELFANPTAPGNYVRAVRVNGDIRKFRLHVPRGYDGTRPLPVLFAFHSSRASASVLERETGFNELADSLGFFAIYPEGMHRAWNIGECCRYSFKKKKDEMAFVTGMLDQLSRGLRVDSTRVYSTGYSDGGTLSFLLACGISSRITAVASVSGTLFEPLPACSLSHPIPVLSIHGTGDHNIPYEGHVGGPAARPGGNHFQHSARDVVRFWLDRENCSSTPVVVRSGNVSKERYECAAGGSEVVFFTIENGQHGWPGGGRGWVFSPKPPTDIVASDTIIAFLLKHRSG